MVAAFKKLVMVDQLPDKLGLSHPSLKWFTSKAKLFDPDAAFVFVLCCQPPVVFSLVLDIVSWALDLSCCRMVQPIIEGIAEK